MFLQISIILILNVKCISASNRTLSQSAVGNVTLMNPININTTGQTKFILLADDYQRFSDQNIEIQGIAHYFNSSIKRFVYESAYGDV